MNSSELMKIKTGAITAQYTQADSFPITPTTNGIGFKVFNIDGSNALNVIATHDDDTTTTITIPANKEWDDLLKPFKSFTTSGSSATFIIQVRTIR